MSTYLRANNTRFDSNSAYLFPQSPIRVLGDKVVARALLGLSEDYVVDRIEDL